MIVVSGFVAVEPSDHEAAVDLIKTLVAATKQEEGCIDYGFYADLESPGRFRVFEEWRDDEAMSAHMGEPHMAEFMAGLGQLTVTETSLTKYEVGETSKLM